jgi:hypothetical protein
MVVGFAGLPDRFRSTARPAAPTLRRSARGSGGPSACSGTAGPGSAETTAVSASCRTGRTFRVGV